MSVRLSIQKDVLIKSSHCYYNIPIKCSFIFIFIFFFECNKNIKMYTDDNLYTIVLLYLCRSRNKYVWEGNNIIIFLIYLLIL